MLLWHSAGFAQFFLSSGGMYVVPETPAMSKIGTTDWASGGSGVVEEGRLSAVYNNPANLALSSLAAAVEVTYRGQGEYAENVHYNGLFAAPALVAFGIPLERWTLALSYFNAATERIASGPIPVTTSQYPDGTGQEFSLTEQVKAHVLAASCRYRLDDRLAFGLTLGGTYVEYRNDLFLEWLRGNGVGLLIVGGLHYTLSDAVSFGGAIRVASQVTPVKEGWFTRATIPPLDSSQIGLPTSVWLPAVLARFPWTAEAGVEWKASGFARFFGTLEFQQWSGVSDNLKSRVQVHLGAAMKPADFLEARLGFFTQNDPYGGLRSQDFITAGITVNYAKASLTVGVMNSGFFHHPVPRGIYGPDFPEFHESMASAGLTFEF